MRIFSLFLLFAIILSPIVIAHEGEGFVSGVDETIRSNSITYVLIASAILALFVIYSIHAYKRPHFTETKKIVLFLGIIIPVILTTVYIVGGTVYLNSISVSKGPVHWHADFEIYGCYDRIDLIEPKGLSNRVGTAVLHEHGDNRLHVEGVVVNMADIELGELFEILGGTLTEDELTVPTEEYVADFKKGDKCNGEEGKVQVFLYKLVNGEIIQEKLDDFREYVLSPYFTVPPGDCLIIEFSPEKEKTSHMCETYKIAIEKGAVSYGS